MSGSSSTSAIVIASVGRPGVLGQVLQHLEAAKPDGCTVVVSVPDENSLPVGISTDVLIHTGTRGAAAQRNAGLDLVLGATEIVYFFDDDALPHPTYFAATEALLRRRPEVVAITGRVLADGAVTGEIAVSEGLGLLRAHAIEEHPAAARPTFSLYGCNFAARASALAVERFDPRLPLYSWLEDLDLSRRLARRGDLMELPAAVCVHLGVRSGGRTSHLRYGYSQVSNPVHLRAKGSISLRHMLYLVFKPATANLVGAVLRADRSRRRRLRGNLMAAKDVLAGRITPERILDLPPDPA